MGRLLYRLGGFAATHRIAMALTWLALAVGAITFAAAERAGKLRASGERADLTPYLPLTEDP